MKFALKNSDFSRNLTPPKHDPASQCYIKDVNLYNKYICVYNQNLLYQKIDPLENQAQELKLILLKFRAAR